MTRRARLATMLALLCLVGLAGSSSGQKPSRTTISAQRPAGAQGTIVVPDRFLRRWDPVTVFFAEDRGAAGGGPEDHPERFVALTPAHPGAFQWLDARTLQFRPAEPWPPLSRSSLKV